MIRSAKILYTWLVYVRTSVISAWVLDMSGSPLRNVEIKLDGVLLLVVVMVPPSCDDNGDDLPFDSFPLADIPLPPPPTPPPPPPLRMDVALPLPLLLLFFI